MALKDILAAMEFQARAEIKKVIGPAEAEAAAMIAKAEDEAKAIKERHLARMKTRLESERWGPLRKAKLAAVREMAEARETLIAEAFAAAEAELARLRESPEYPEWLKRLAREVADALGQRPHIMVDARDESLMRRIVSEMGIEAEISTGLDVAGGLEASTADGRITMLNTFGSRLKLGQRHARQMIASILVAGNP